MISAKEIQATCDDIVRECLPLQVILFGSYAYGAPTNDSDVDLLVVMTGMSSDMERQKETIQKRIPRRFRRGGQAPALRVRVAFFTVGRGPVPRHAPIVTDLRATGEGAFYFPSRSRGTGFPSRCG